MAALLVALSVMSVLLTVVMPVWKQASQREKETELVFRIQQYARAIALFQRRAGPGALPPNLDVLVQQRFLRKKYKDPITGDDFLPIMGGAGPESGGAATPGGRGGRGGSPPATITPGAGITGAVGGVAGVVSKSKAKSIRILAGRSVYNEWTSMLVAPQQPGVTSIDAPGRGGRGVPQPGGGRGTRGTVPAPGGRGNPAGGFGTPSAPPISGPPIGKPGAPPPR